CARHARKYRQKPPEARLQKVERPDAGWQRKTVKGDDMKSQKQDHEFDELEKEARDFLSPLQQLASPPSLRDKLRRATSTGIKQEGTALMEPVDTTTHFSRHRSLWKRKIT